MFPNAKGSELFSVLATIDPASQAVGTTSTGWISAGNHHNLLALIQSGALGTNATLDAKLQQAQDASGTGAKDLTGKAISQLTQAASGSAKQALINLRPDDLDVTNGYGEQYLLTFDESKNGSIVFSLTSVGANVGAGKKVSQTAAFDIAYIKFLRAASINFPTFVCHDGVEAVHGNQLSELLTTANSFDGQLVLAAIRDKLPGVNETFLEENTILELSQDDKLFQL